MKLLVFSVCLVLVSLVTSEAARTDYRNQRRPWSNGYNNYPGNNYFNYDFPVARARGPPTTTTTTEPSTTTQPTTTTTLRYVYHKTQKSNVNPWRPTTTTAKPVDRRRQISNATAAPFFQYKPSVEMMMALRNITDPLEFVEKYVDDHILGRDATGTTKSKANFKSEITNIMRGRDSAQFAPPASCSPQPTTVEIEKGHSPYDIYFPSCTRLERCGGCCSHELLECAPSKSEIVPLNVLVTRYLGPPSNKFDVGEIKTINLERHLECQCQCRVKESDCRWGIQVYRPNECRCQCINQAEAQNCVGNKIWDTTHCTCRCREYLECSTGYNFNDDTCMCEVGRVSRMGFGPGFRDMS